jgi:hypothetical protein
MFRRLLLGGNAGAHAALAARTSRYMSGTNPGTTPDTKAAASFEATENYYFERCVKTFPVPLQAFEAKPEVKDSMRNFIADCNAGVSFEELQRSAHMILGQLGCNPRDVKGFDVRNAIEAATYGTRTLFDGNSVVFNLGHDRQVQVLVTKEALKNPNLDPDSPFFRHRNVARYSAASTDEVVKQFDAQPPALPLLFGDSGSGKTLCGISAVAYMDRTNGPGACLRLLCTSDKFAVDVAELLGSDPTQTAVLSKWHADNPSVDTLSIDDFEQIYKKVGQRPAFQEERNQVAQQFVLRAMDAVIEAKHRHAPMSARPLVVFIDEAGPCPTFVRAMCVCFSVLESAISDRFSRGKCKVKIIMAGTGIEGANHHVSSEPERTWLHHVQPNAWSELKKDPEVPAGILQLLESSPDASVVDTSVIITNGMLRNARVAAIFVEEVKLFKRNDFVEQSPMLAMRAAATIAGLSYKNANRRNGLSAGADFAVLLRAMAQQTRDFNVHSGWSLLAKYGLLVDRAEALAIDDDTAKRMNYAKLGSLDAPTTQKPDAPTAQKPDAPTAQKPKALFLHRDYLGVRYELGIAHVMMLQLALHIGEHAETSDGFERVAADFIAVALELSRPDVNMDFNFFRATPPWRMPNGWMAPLMLAERLRRSAPLRIARKSRDDPSLADVDRIISSMQLMPWDDSDGTSASAMKQYLKEHILPTRTPPQGTFLPQLGTVVVNAPQASYADVIAFVGTNELLLVNAKSHTANQLALPPVFRELYKMGHRDWRSVLAEWLEKGGDDDLPSYMLPYLSQKGRNRYVKRPSALAIQEQDLKPSFVRCIADATDREKQWLINSKYGKANNELTDLLREGIKHVTYVIMVYGKSPTALPPDLSVPDDVLLLFAPSPPHTDRSSTPASESFAAEQLWGYYPVVVNPPLSPAHLKPILMPKDDRIAGPSC